MIVPEVIDMELDKIFYYHWMVLMRDQPWRITSHLCNLGCIKSVWIHAGVVCAVPGYISRSVAGSYDNEGIAIFALMFTYFMWVSTQNSAPVVLPNIL